MTKQMLTDYEIMEQAVQIAAMCLRRAAEMQKLADSEAARPRRRLSAKAWLAAALRQAGHDAVLIEVLRTVLQTRAAQYPGVASYVHAMAAAISQGEWRGVQAALTGAPASWRASREDAEREIAVIGGGMNLWSCVSLAIADLAASDPEAFGDCDDVDEEQRQRTAVALATLAATPMEILLGLALARGIAVEPRANLAARLVAHEQAGAPRPAARARTPEGVALLTGAR